MDRGTDNFCKQKFCGCWCALIAKRIHALQSSSRSRRLLLQNWKDRGQKLFASHFERLQLVQTRTEAKHSDVRVHLSVGLLGTNRELERKRKRADQYWIGGNEGTVCAVNGCICLTNVSRGLLPGTANTPNSRRTQVGDHNQHENVECSESKNSVRRLLCVTGSQFVFENAADPTSRV